MGDLLYDRKYYAHPLNSKDPCTLLSKSDMKRMLTNAVFPLHVYILWRKYQSDKRKIKYAAHVSLKMTKVVWFFPSSLRDALILQKRKLIQTESVIASLPDDLNCEPDYHILWVQKRLFSLDKESTGLFLKLPCNHMMSVKVNKSESLLTKAGKGLQKTFTCIKVENFSLTLTAPLFASI